MDNKQNLPADVLMEQYLRQGEFLAENKWKDYVEGLEGYPRVLTAILLENTDRAIQSMEETTKVVNIGSFTKYVFPLVRAIFPNLIAMEICSVQPMTGPASLIFYFDFVYGTSKGAVSAGTKVFDAVAGPNMQDYTYSSETVKDETIGTGDGSKTTFSASLAFIPVRPGTVTVVAASVTGTDNGSGTISGTGISSGTIDYTSGAISITFSSAPANGVSVKVTYEYNSETQQNIPEIDILLSSSPVTARPRKLRARWGLESANNLKALYGLDADTELVAALAEEIRFEIDREVIDDIWNNAYTSNTVSAWDATSGTGVSYTEHKLSLIDKFVTGSNNIFQNTKRATGNWIVMGTGVANVVETLPGFRPDPAAGAIGVVRMGTLNGRWACYKDPWMVSTRYLVGHKGVSFLEAGYVYAPYIPLMTTPVVVLDDFVGRRGILTQYAKKLINARFYAQGTVTNLPS